MSKTAILVDGGFYRKRAAHLWGKKTAEERAKELNAYCHAHMQPKDGPPPRASYTVFFTTIVNRLAAAAFTIHLQSAISIWINPRHIPGRLHSLKN